MKEIKHFIANILRKNKLTDSFIYKILLLVNNVLFHRKERFMLKKYGEKNPSCIFYVIRNNSLEEGLLSIYFNVLSEIEYALGKGYIPYVDLQNNITQYTTGELVNGTRNAWEYFWKQPSQYRMEDIYQSKNVILCGKNRKVDKEKRLGKMNKLIREYDFSDIESTHELYCFIKEYAEVMPYIYEKVNSIWKLSFQDNKVIGVFIRGTDYVAFSPKGHSIQPTKEYIYEQLMILRKNIQMLRYFLLQKTI